MLRRNFMSAVGLSGFGSFFGRNTVAPVVPSIAAPSFDFDKIYRIEEEREGEVFLYDRSEIRYLKVCESVQKQEHISTYQMGNYLIIDGELTKKYSLVYHNPDGPAVITKYYDKDQQHLSSKYYWFLNGKHDSTGARPYSINVRVKENIFRAHLPDSRLIFFNTEPNSKGQTSMTIEIVNSIEQFESKIGMTIEKLLSFN